MANDSQSVTSWTDRAMSKLVELAQTRIRLAGSGNAKEVQHVVAHATLALRDVVSGRLPDPERTEYLRFVLESLERMNRGMDPQRAFGSRVQRSRGVAKVVPAPAVASQARPPGR